MAVTVLCCLIMALVDGVIRPGYAVKSAIKIAVFLLIPLITSRGKCDIVYLSLLKPKMKAMGIARSLQYEGNGAIPIYNVDEAGNLLLGSINQPDSFLREYEFKLKNLYDRLYTGRGREIAQSRRLAAQQFCNALVGEIKEGHTTLHSVLNRLNKETNI